MATEKFLNKEGLERFYELIDSKYIDTTELNTDKGLAWANIDPDDTTSAKKVEIKLGDGLDFDVTGAIKADGLSPATDVKLGTIKTWVDTYDEDDNPTGTDIGTTMVASDPTAPTVLDRIQLVGVQGTREKGQANGYASLDSNGLVPASQLPSYVDDVIEGYYNSDDNKFYESFTAGDPDADPVVPDTYDDEITAESGKIYVDLNSGTTYRWSGSTWVEISSGAFDIITIAEIEALFS